MNLAVQLESRPVGTVATDPGDEATTTDISDGKMAPSEPLPQEEGVSPVVDEELPEDQLMWLGRS